MARQTHVRCEGCLLLIGHIEKRGAEGLTDDTCGCLFFGFCSQENSTHAGEINGEEGSRRAPPFFLWGVGV